MFYVFTNCEQDQDEDVPDCKIKHDWGKDAASKGSLRHQGNKHYHQKSTVGCSQTTNDGKS
jgi:hypothetical protein